VRLFLRLNADVNERLRSLMRYQGELSRYIDEALTVTDLGGIDLIVARPGKRTPGLTAGDLVGRIPRGDQRHDSGAVQ
jgi:hypothetical protein